ncbi:MAG: hypothetical protein K8S25_09550 [Alphaproteobacteria bacterium]|nr:hypothetical protein [Alphaproteobacteria bacterium]
MRPAPTRPVQHRAQPPPTGPPENFVAVLEVSATETTAMQTHFTNDRAALVARGLAAA